jgi:hypothetical protein
MDRLAVEQDLTRGDLILPLEAVDESVRELRYERRTTCTLGRIEAILLNADGAPEPVAYCICRGVRLESLGRRKIGKSNLELRLGAGLLPRG